MGEIDFVVLKINGKSVQHLSQDEAVQAFLKNNEPFQIEVQQLQTTLNSSSVGEDNNIASLVLTLRCLTVSSTDCVRKTEAETQIRDLTHPDVIAPVMPNRMKYNFDFIEQENENATIVAANNERLIEEEHVLFDQCLAPEIDIEEVTLRKSNSNELLGLSIIYSGTNSGCKTNSGGSNNDGSGSGSGGSGGENNNDVCTEVYISRIQKDSVAGRDGRLRQGDQILQINGKDIKTKEETETLIAENNNAVTLLVSRYLYTDEDDFNDPSLVVDLEDEEDDVIDGNVETDEEEDEDEEGDDLYVENNSAYENDKMHLVKNLSRVLIVQEEIGKVNERTDESNTTTNNGNLMISPAVIKKPINKFDNNVNAAIEKEKEQTARRSNNQKEVDFYIQNNKTTHEQQQQQQVHKSTEKANTKKKVEHPLTESSSCIIDSETEHIYETIPEDSEAEPFYCSPYESSTYVNAVGTCSSMSTSTIHPGLIQMQQRQKQRVAQWLNGLCEMPTSSSSTPSTLNTTLFPRRTIPLLQKNTNTSVPQKQSLGRERGRGGGCAKNKSSDTIRSVVTITTNGSSSSGERVDASAVIINQQQQQEEQDNSSSAYNTGGSNGSANNHPMRNDDFIAKALQDEIILTTTTTTTPLATRAVKRSQLLTKDNKEKTNSKPPIIGFGTHKVNCNSRHCDELAIPDTLIRMYPPLLSTCPSNVDKRFLKEPSSAQTYSRAQTTTQAAADQLPRTVSMLCPNFTAPNLHQYRFVSSQEVSALHPGTFINCDTAKRSIEQKQQQQQQQQQQSSMVWKVKRRPDGSRYIVRRPAAVTGIIEEVVPTLNFSSRTRRNARNDPTTTEDDTISEVKTGRYWSKEERKKHVERARERRLQQQQQQQQQQMQLHQQPHKEQQQQQFLEGSMCFSEKMIARLQQHRKNRQRYQILKVHQVHQDLQFGGANVSQTFPPNIQGGGGTTCDGIGLKQQPATVVTSSVKTTNFATQQNHPCVILSPPAAKDDQHIAAAAATAAIPAAIEENDFSENYCSSP